jgi:hypothetical protein
VEEQHPYTTVMNGHHADMMSIQQAYSVPAGYTLRNCNTHQWFFPFLPSVFLPSFLRAFILFRRHAHLSSFRHAV